MKFQFIIHQKDKKSSGIHFYGGMSHLGLTDLIKDQNVTAAVYILKVLPASVNRGTEDDYLQMYLQMETLIKLSCLKK